MLISKKSRRAAERLASWFPDAPAGEFPLRQYLRLREDLSTGLAQAALTAVLVVLVVALGRALDGLWRAHGPGRGSWLRLASWIVVAAFALSVGRRLYYKLVELRQIRREMGELRAAFRETVDEDAARDRAAKPQA